MPDDPQTSDWTRASAGLYGLSLDELKLVLTLAYEYLEWYGREITPTELRVALRRPSA